MRPTRRAFLVGGAVAASRIAPGVAADMAEPKRISLRRDGAPYQSGIWQSDFAALSPGQRQEFLALLSDLDREPPPPPGSAVPDGLSYAITIEWDGQARKITAHDGAMSEAFQRLEAWLRETLPRRPPG